MNPILIVTHLINGLLMVFMPILLGVVLARKFQIGWRLWWIGGVTFILSQLGHIPFNVAVGLLFERGFLNIPASISPLVFSAVFAGLSAGLWEECFRYGAFRWWAKDARTWSKGVMLGAGWGGAEAIILGVLVLVNYAVMLSLQYSDLTSAAPESQIGLLTEQMAVYWSLPWDMTLIGALERAFALLVQIALSVMVLQAFTRRNIGWLFLAIGWHALIDALAVYLIRTSGVYTTEAVVGLLAVISLILIFVLRQPEAPPPAPEISPLPDASSRAMFSPDDHSLEKLEESKYN